MSLPDHLQGLLTPAAFPHPVAAVEVVETQLSWVLLAGERVYKIKRPVVYPFVDFSTLERRRHFCLEELRLNRRFAPELYLEVCSISGSGEQARIGGPGPATEYAVVLRRFDRKEELDALVRDGRISAAELATFGKRLADIHKSLPRSTGDDAGGQPAAIAAAITRNVAECADAAGVFGGAARVAEVGRSLADECGRLQPALARRMREGCVRECHGDLHLSNVVRMNGELTPFDCLEFEPAFRHIDVAQDVAFMTADLHGYDQPRLATAFLNGWLTATGDYDACTVLRLYEADRALVRAKVLALLARATPGPTPPMFQQYARRHAGYVAVAEQALAPGAPLCIMMHGLPGSGKSWLAARLAAELAAVHISSDVERKRGAGLQPLDPSHSATGQGLYTAAQTELVYERLSQCAAQVLSGQRTVIVDANFGLQLQRAVLTARCRELGLRVCVVSCDAPTPVLLARIQSRQTHAAESEAGAAVLWQQMERRELIDAAEGLMIVVADTSQPDVVQRTCEALRRQVVR